jgi:hypothetical protein
MHKSQYGFEDKRRVYVSMDESNAHNSTELTADSEIPWSRALER